MSLSSALPHKLQQARAQSSGTSVAYLAYNLRVGQCEGEDNWITD